jgi:RNA polymerase sigma-70 factor (ECF subfamily)
MSDPSVDTVQMHKWLERMRAGDLSARDELLRAFCARLESLARKMLRRFPQVQRWAQTDDVLQNALMRLLRSLQKVEPDSVRAFLGLAAVEMRRELLDLARHFYGPRGVGANHESHGSDGGQTVAKFEPAVQEDQEDLERWHDFHVGVESLPAEEREVVSLIFYHGWTQIEVAQLLQAGERTIRRRWESALLKLNLRLKLCQ